MIVGYVGTLDIHIKPKKGEKTKRFELHWIGTFCSYPNRDTLGDALIKEGIDNMNSGDKRLENKGRNILAAGQIVKQMPDWPDKTLGRLTNEFLTFRVQDIPIHGDITKAHGGTLAPSAGSPVPPPAATGGEPVSESVPAGDVRPPVDVADDAVREVQPAGSDVAVH